MTINFNEHIKSKFVRGIIIAALAIFVILIVIGSTTNIFEEIGNVKFNTNRHKADTAAVNKEGDNRIKIDKMDGDILQDNSTKNEYHYKEDTSNRNKKN